MPCQANAIGRSKSLEKDISLDFKLSLSFFPNFKINSKNIASIKYYFLLFSTLKILEASLLFSHKIFPGLAFEKALIEGKGDSEIKTKTNEG